MARRLTQAEKETRAEIKRFNTRIATIYKKFGKDSITYKNLVAKFSASQFKGIITTATSGALKIKTTRVAIQASNISNVVNIARNNVFTMTRYREMAQNQLGKVSLPQKQVIQQIEEQNSIGFEFKKLVDHLYDTRTRDEIVKELPELKKGREGVIEYNDQESILARDNIKKIIQEYNERIPPP